MNLRYATIEDLPEIQSVFSYAREFMKNTGNPNQWGDSRPLEASIKEDIINKQLFLISEGEELCGVFAFIIGNDPTYDIIEDGAWLNSEPYGTIHKIAGNGKMKGIFEIALSYCQSKIDNIRIDTHADNKVMKGILDKNGFKRCGTIYVDDGTPRIAYQKIVRN